MRNTGRRLPSGMRGLPPARLDSSAAQQVRELWWRQRCHEGVELPAERGVIVIRGGRG